METCRKNATLPASFYQRDPVTVARAMLGQLLVRVCDGGRLSGIIVETEAYLGVEDRAAHSWGGRRTRRNETMYQAGGVAYVYFTYGMHFMLNAVTGMANDPTAVLIRAAEPVEGLERMFANRPKALSREALCSGPGKLAQAFQIDLSLNGANLTTSPFLFIERIRQRSLPARQIRVTPRIGVDYAGEWAARPLRFHISGNPNASRPAS